MIIITLPNTVLHDIKSGMAIIEKGTTLPVIVDIPVNDICYCDFECEYTEKVFAHNSGDFWKNDTNEFLFKRFVPSDTVVIKLFKNDIEVATITDDTLGTFFNGFPLGSAEQKLYVGFLIDWLKVFNVHGTGIYVIKTAITIVGVPETKESQRFRLYQYSDKVANGTVRIETTQNGNIIGSEFDYTGLNWKQSCRIKGRFGNRTPKKETHNFLNNNYELKQIQDKITSEWTLFAELLPANISNQIIYDNTLANEYLVTDYNILNHDVYRRVSLYPTELGEPKYFKGNRNVKYEITFTNKFDDNIKRN